MLCVHMYVQVPVHVCSSKVDIRCLLLLFPLAFETGSPAEPGAETGLPVDPGVLCLCLPDTEAPDFFFFSVMWMLGMNLQAGVYGLSQLLRQSAWRLFCQVFSSPVTLVTQCYWLTLNSCKGYSVLKEAGTGPDNSGKGTWRQPENSQYYKVSLGS